jgi:phosphoenolpyruvate carboxykinase (ATP)
MYPDGSFDLFDKRLTENSRASYPLSFLRNTKVSSNRSPSKDHNLSDCRCKRSSSPDFAPESRTDHAVVSDGYTSKLAGTETTVIEPVSTFSRFFGQPFMPCLPHLYSDLLGKKMKTYNSDVYLINTGWSGGPYGIGRRMDINLTRTLLDAAMGGKLADVEYREEKYFHLHIPGSCPGVPPEILNPENTWDNKNAYKERAIQLAAEFGKHFDKAYGNKSIDEKVRMQCPGK